jgi:hypothetical protein
MTPLGIEILLHYYTTPGQYRDGDFSAPAVSEALRHFADTGLLRGNHRDGYTSTEATEVYVGAICSVPAPVQKWVIPSEAA